MLQYADGNAEKMLQSRDFLNLSEHMLLVVMQRDIQVCMSVRLSVCLRSMHMYVCLCVLHVRAYMYVVDLATVV